MALKSELAAYEGKQQVPVPVTLPVFNLKNGNIEQEAREDEQHRDTIRTIKAGREAWQAIGKAGSQANWVAIGSALAIGKAHALRVTGSNAAWGQNYSCEFGQWMKDHGFGAMRPSDRSVAIELVENLAAIESWRQTLSERKRRRLNSAQAIVRRWRLSAAGKQCEHDLAKAAMTAWKRFVTCVEALPQSEATALWRMVQAESATRL
jgi:hypothetical protein